jgi:putative restriction endonuclease
LLICPDFPYQTESLNPSRPAVDLRQAMSKSVFTHRVGSRYDDLPESKYHFPQTYLRQVERSVGDLIIYYEPRRDNGRQSYVATARVVGVEIDPQQPGHFYALISEYLEFPQIVPYRIGDQFFEGKLRGANGTTNLGTAQRAVRDVPEHEFEAILTAAFSAATSEPSQTELANRAGISLNEPAETFDRPIIQTLISRPFRDIAFKAAIRRAYKDTCAFTGLKLINGGGRPEIDAAHIRPVGEGHNGPDSVRNGLALCKTAHWLFDRGLVTLDDDLKIVQAKGLVGQEVSRLLHADGIARVPEASHFRPHSQFLQYHRDHIFKG